MQGSRGQSADQDFCTHPILTECQSAQKTSWQAHINKVSWLINQFATRRNRMKLIYATQLNSTLSPPSCLQPSLLLSCLGWKEIQAHHNCILSILLKSSVAVKVIYHPNCLSFSLPISNCVSLSPSSRLEWAGVRLWPQETVNSLENGRCLMGRHTGPPAPPTHHPNVTPDPFTCLYQTMEVRNSDESLWLCVYTPESRKEGNQPRSAKSGEVRENSCSPPELQWFTSQSQNLFHVISAAKTVDQQKTATLTAQ